MLQFLEIRTNDFGQVRCNLVGGSSNKYFTADEEFKFSGTELPAFLMRQGAYFWAR